MGAWAQPSRSSSASIARSPISRTISRSGEQKLDKDQSRSRVYRCAALPWPHPSPEFSADAATRCWRGRIARNAAAASGTPCAGGPCRVGKRDCPVYSAFPLIQRVRRRKRPTENRNRCSEPSAVAFGAHSAPPGRYGEGCERRRRRVAGRRRSPPAHRGRRAVPPPSEPR